MPFKVIKEKGGSLVWIEAAHPAFAIDMTNGEIGIIQQCGIVAGDAVFPIRQVAIDQRIKNALKVQSKLWPSREVRMFGQIPRGLKLENEIFEPRQV